jgi:hypothetical protein
VSRRVALAYAAAGLGLAIICAVLAVGLRITDPVPLIENAFGFSDAALFGFVCFGLAFAVVGALLVVRRPENTVGWLMVVVGVAHAAAGLLGTLASSAIADGPDRADAAAVLAWTTIACVILGAMVFDLAVLFPTGRGHTRGWDRLGRLYPAGLAVAAAFILTQPGPLNTFPTVDNPFAIGPPRSVAGIPVSELALSASVLIAPVFAWAIVSRYRASGSIVRRQLKWFVLSMLVAMTALAVTLLAPLVTDKPPEIGLALFGFGGALIPIAIGIAILRHGLYDIDRLISRTISYALVTGVLAAVFAGSVVGLSAVLGSLTNGNALAVALSTLLVAVLFGPLRRRAQAAIDRRFDRARYDGERTARAFAERLRDEIDIETVVGDLRATVDDSIHPTASGLWLR